MKKVDNKDGAVSIIGLGAMGTALAKTLLMNRTQVTVWNRSPEKATALVADGAIVAKNAEEAIRNSDVSILCVSDYGGVADILHSIRGGVAGKSIINLTNGTPDQASTMGKWAAAHSAEYLDGGIMAIPPMIGTPDALVFYSGSALVYKRWRGVLEQFGKAHYLEGDVGLASLYDISLLISMYGLFSGFFQATALAKANGVKAVEITRLIIPWATAMTQALSVNAEQIDSRNYELGVVSNLGMQTTAYNNLIEACKNSGISIELMLPLKVMFDQAVSDGYSKGDISAVLEIIGAPK